MARFFRRRKFCRFTADGVKEIDYKDLETLRQYITETGKIVLQDHGDRQNPRFRNIWIRPLDLSPEATGHHAAFATLEKTEGKK